MADSMFSDLTALTGANVDPANDLLAIRDTSVTTTKKITIQEAFNAASTLTALTGSGVDATADSIPIYDNSATSEKKILVEELGTALGATQAQQETATSTKVTVNPSNQQFHPSAPKAWGFVTTPTTVSAGYPGSGVSVAENATGSYTVTHGKTFSSANYAVIVTSGHATKLYGGMVTSKDATTFTVKFRDSGDFLVDPTTFNYACFGDLA